MPQYTSARNCSRALCSMGPLQMTGWSSPTKKPMEMQATPWATGGTMRSSITTGVSSSPSMRGTEKPYTSASSTPTWWPRRAKATATFTVTEDLPTPPLPEETPTTLVRAPGRLKGFSLLTVSFRLRGVPPHRWPR